MQKFLIIFISFLMTITPVIAENVTKTKLSNGQSLIIKEIHSNPIVMIDTWVKTGSVDENDCNNGVAHFLEHLFFKGSENYPNGQFDKILESKGAITNAATSKDFTHFHILIPSKDFETALKLHADMLTKPSFPIDEINKERNVVIREIERSNDNPSRKLYNTFTKSMYPNHPYKREVLGTKKIIAEIPREEIINFYSSHYSPENLITVIVGDIESKQAVDLVKKYFNNNDKDLKIKQEKTYKQDNPPAKQINIHEKDDVKTSSLIIGYKCGLKISDKDSFALDLLSVILGQGKSSRFYRNIKDSKQLAQSITANHSSMKQDSIFLISASFNEEDIENLKNEIFQEIENIKKYGVTQSELNRAKKMLERETMYARESVSDTASEIGYSTLITDDWNFYDEYLKKLNTIKANDIKNAAKKYLNSNNTVIAYLTPNVPQEKIQKTLSCNNQNNNNNNQVISKPCFIPKKHTPLKMEKSGNLEKYTLENNAILLIDKHKNNGIIAIDIKIKGGNYLNQKHGVSNIVSSVILQGTEKYPKNIFSELTEENGIKIQSSGNKEYFSLTMQCTKKDLPMAMDILNEVISKASLNNEDIEKTKQTILHSIKQSQNNPSNVVFEELSYELWKNTPYDTSNKSIEKDLPKISQQDIKNYYTNLFDSKNAIIAVNGNVNEQEIINYFSEIITPKNQPYINYSEYKSLFNSNQKKQTITTNQGKESAWLVIAWKTDGLSNKKDRATLKVINAILGSGMSSRLFSEVRAEKGLAYAIGSTDMEYINKGAFCIYIGTDPQKINEAEKSIFLEVEKLKKEHVTEKELEVAKNKIKGEAILAMETNASKAHFISVSEQNGNGYDYYFEKFNNEIDKVSVQDIINTANKYFSDNYTVSKVFPKK
ncbi:insulinase family protein [bacterium]|nr:insulinase family protein [bacterium]